MSKRNPWRTIDSCPEDKPVLLGAYDVENAFMVVVGQKEQEEFFALDTKASYEHDGITYYGDNKPAFTPQLWRKLPKAPR